MADGAFNPGYRFFNRGLAYYNIKIKGIFRERLWRPYGIFRERLTGGLGSHGGSPNQGVTDTRRSKVIWLTEPLIRVTGVLIGVLHITI